MWTKTYSDNHDNIAYIKFPKHEMSFKLHEIVGMSSIIYIIYLKFIIT